MTGRVIGERYEIKEKIGSGGMAEVYSAHDNLLDRLVAVKILHEAYRSDAEFIERFTGEAKAAARLAHPNIVSIYDVGIDGEDHFIVMEYVQGKSLKDKIREEGALDILTATKIAKDIANGLAHAHAHNLVHCDIKPHNILMTPEGVAKIADFGIARAITESTMTYSGNVIGSVHYFSPEQAQGGTITPKSDIYSLGIVMYEMLTNKLPFTGENPVTIAMKHIEEDAVPPSVYNPKIPPMLEAVVIRAMNKNPELRPSSFDMIRSLSNVEASLSVEQTDDPDATKILPRIEIENLPPRRNIHQNAINSSNKKPARKVFIKSKVFITGLITFLIFGFGAGVLMAFGEVGKSEEIAVPNVTGKQLNLAQQILESENLRVNVAEIYNSKVPAGEVVRQDPDAGRNVKLERMVTIYVSKGGETIDMPDLVGLTKDVATKRLQKIGLQIGSVYEKESEKKAGILVSQYPAAGTKINRGEIIDLVVSNGVTRVVANTPPPVKTAPQPAIQKILVPNVQNVNLEFAKSGIVNSGLIVGKISYQESSQAENTIISQNPAPAAYVDAGTKVNLVVSYEKETEYELAGEYKPLQQEVSSPFEIDEPSREDNGTKSQW